GTWRRTWHRSCRTPPPGSPRSAGTAAPASRTRARCSRAWRPPPPERPHPPHAARTAWAGLILEPGRRPALPLFGRPTATRALVGPVAGWPGLWLAPATALG